MRIFFCFFCILMPSSSFSTSCETLRRPTGSYEPFIKDYEASDIVFYGKVISQYDIDKHLIPQENSAVMNRQVTALEPIEFYKPNIQLPKSQPKESFVFITSRIVAGDLELELGEYYLLFGKRAAGGLYEMIGLTCGGPHPKRYQELEPFLKWKNEYDQRINKP